MPSVTSELDHHRKRAKVTSASKIKHNLAEDRATYRSVPSSTTFGVVNESDRILIMIDEAHRTQDSDMGDNLFEAFPNATHIAFTGTQLITEQLGNKRTVKRFGEYIDEYKLMDAVNDGATGDILEAELRIEAIAKNLVAHYIENIFPDDFKAQVVCHSKIAAIRYQASIRKAIAERIEHERLAKQPDSELIRKLETLKAAVVVSADQTNEPAAITEARKEAKRWNAVENFCKPFDFDDPDASLTGIAFLVVCDMLLTGFDAPIEQVMYIDKKLKEHNLLQAIARVNRTAENKHRGFIVDYIGLSNNLTAALSIYSKEDQLDLQEGLKNSSSELPILEERYQRLIQHFRNAGVQSIEAFVKGELSTPETEVLLIHQAVKILKDIKRRADFEVYLKKFLLSLNLILPHPSGHPYRGIARRFG